MGWRLTKKVETFNVLNVRFVLKPQNERTCHPVGEKKAMKGLVFLSLFVLACAGNQSDTAADTAVLRDPVAQDPDTTSRVRAPRLCTEARATGESCWYCPDDDGDGSCQACPIYYYGTSDDASYRTFYICQGGRIPRGSPYVFTNDDVDDTDVSR